MTAKVTQFAVEVTETTVARWLPTGAGNVEPSSWEFTGTAAEAVADYATRTGVAVVYRGLKRESVGSRPWFVRAAFPDGSVANLMAATVPQS